jgi:hypothetical protein
MKPNFRVVDLAQDLTNRTAKNIQHLAIECRWHERLDALSKVCKLNTKAGLLICVSILNLLKIY